MKKYIAILITLALSGFGCLEREEKINISSAGALTVEWKVSGDEDDALNGLKLPEGTPWKIKQWKEPKEGKERFNYLAQAEFDSVEKYSKSIQFGPEDLHIETNLEIKKIGTNTYYFFKRLYFARDWWRFQTIREKEIDKKLEQRVSDKGIKSLNPEERQKFLSGLANFEIKKRLLLASDGLGYAMLKSQFPYKIIPETLGELDKIYVKVITPEQIEKLLDMDSAPQAEQISTIKKSLVTQQDMVLSQALRDYAKVDFKTSMAQVNLNYELTEDLMDENFKVHITMPGKIILSNGERESDETVYWEFNGKDLLNRHIPLEIVSVVEKD